MATRTTSASSWGNGQFENLVQTGVVNMGAYGLLLASLCGFNLELNALAAGIAF